MYLSVEEGLLHFHARRMEALWILREHPAVTSILNIRVVGVAEHDAGQDEEDSRDDELDGPEGDEEAFAPHFLRGGYGGHYWLLRFRIGSNGRCCCSGDEVGRA
jgi:hypothetical protein